MSDFFEEYHKMSILLWEKKIQINKRFEEIAEEATPIVKDIAAEIEKLSERDASIEKLIICMPLNFFRAELRRAYKQKTGTMPDESCLKEATTPYHLSLYKQKYKDLRTKVIEAQKENNLFMDEIEILKQMLSKKINESQKRDKRIGYAIFNFPDDLDRVELKYLYRSKFGIKPSKEM